MYFPVVYIHHISNVLDLTFSGLVFKVIHECNHYNECFLESYVVKANGLAFLLCHYKVAYAF